MKKFFLEHWKWFLFLALIFSVLATPWVAVNYLRNQEIQINAQIASYCEKNFPNLFYFIKIEKEVDKELDLKGIFTFSTVRSPGDLFPSELLSGSSLLLVVFREAGPDFLDRDPLAMLDFIQEKFIYLPGGERVLSQTKLNRLTEVTLPWILKFKSVPGWEARLVDFSLKLSYLEDSGLNALRKQRYFVWESKRKWQSWINRKLPKACQYPFPADPEWDGI